jgi:hypothetical protein
VSPSQRATKKTIKGANHLVNSLIAQLVEHVASAPKKKSCSFEIFDGATICFINLISDRIKFLEMLASVREQTILINEQWLSKE